MSATGVVSPDVLMSYDGVSFLRALLEGTLPPPPITETLGFRLASVAPGRVVFEGEPQLKHYNPIGSVHGGFAMTLLGKGETYTTLEIKVNLVRPLTKDTGLVSAEGRIIHRGRSVGTAEGDVKDKSGKLYAHATTTCMIFPATS
jgi:uncharacterized protein (TIGR00369 family)